MASRLAIPKVQRPNRNGGITAPRSTAGGPTRRPAYPHVPQVNQTGGANRATSLNPLTKQYEAGQAATTGSTSEAAATPVAAPAAPTPAAGTAASPSPAPQTTDSLFPEPAYTGDPGQDPRDSTYWNNLAKLKWTDEGEYAKTKEEEAKSDSGYAYATTQALHDRMLEQRKIGESGLSNGLANSGYHDRVGTEAAQQYTEQRSHADLSHGEEKHAFEVAREKIREGWTIDAAAELIEAGHRFTEKREGEAEEGGPEAQKGEVGAPARHGTHTTPGKGPKAKVDTISEKAGDPWRQYLKNLREGKKK